jgi:hypothetical protein
MKITISTRSVVAMAAEAGLPESIIDRHLDSLCSFALHLQKQERKRCAHKIRGWQHDFSPGKGPVTDILEEGIR